MYLFSFLINQVRKSFSAVTYSGSWRYLNTYDRKLLRAYTKHFEIPLLRLLRLYRSNLKSENYKIQQKFNQKVVYIANCLVTLVTVDAHYDTNEISKCLV